MKQPTRTVFVLKIFGILKTSSKKKQLYNTVKNDCRDQQKMKGKLFIANLFFKNYKDGIKGTF